MFTCTLCNLELKNRFHECGKNDGPHKVEVIAGGRSWGNIRMGLSGTKDNSQ